MIRVIKRNGTLQEYNRDKIFDAILKAFNSTGESINRKSINQIIDKLQIHDQISIEEIQDQIENALLEGKFYKTAKAFVVYRYKHSVERELQERINYMVHYRDSKDNAADSSETDANANVSLKNVANLDGELYKTTNRKLQRRMVEAKLKELYPDEYLPYSKDLESHIIYTHDEASSPVPKNYCEAVSLYPLLTEGVGNMDGVTPTPPQHLESFCGQFNNLVFLLSAQCKGAVAFGEFFNYFDYFCVKDFGEEWHQKLDELTETSIVTKPRTIKDRIEAAFQTIVYYINQPAGNRSYQSPFTNVSYYDRYYWKALFEDFMFPDGTKPEWERVSCLQKMFMKWFNKERTKAVLTFFVETMALLVDKDGNYLDEEYKQFTAEMQAEGHSFFVYVSDNPGALASCCRLRNEIESNEFSFTNGLTGVMTGSCNVITLNLNRIIQTFYKIYGKSREDILTHKLWNTEYRKLFKDFLILILERVYKYHIAYKTILYEWEDAGMFSSCNAGYIHFEKLFSTIGINGLNEAARFVGLEVTYSKEYQKFCNLITSTISEQNKLHKTKRFKFNTEFVPAESLSEKNYKWDLEDHFWVPEDTKIYNSYFYNAWDDTSILDKFKLQGREFTSSLDGGVGYHCNLEDHLSKEQYLKLLDYAAKVGTTYFTYNIPNSECTNKSCHYITKHPMEYCPKCGSPMIQWSRVVGFLRPVTKYPEGRRWDYNHRMHTQKKDVEIY